MPELADAVKQTAGSVKLGYVMPSAIVNCIQGPYCTVSVFRALNSGWSVYLHKKY